MKRILFVLLMMICSVSWAEWVAVQENDQGILFVDRVSIKRRGNIASMWVMVNFHRIKQTASGKYQSVKVFSHHDCADRTSGTQTIVMYSKLNGSGSTVFSTSTRINEIEFEPVVPGAMGEREWEIACGKN